MGFGHRPEFFCQSYRQGISLDRCIELMDVDLQIKSTSGNGVVIPLRGAAITNELQTMWQPTWISYALGKLIAIDATLVGLEIFPVYSFSGVVTVDEVRRLVPVLQDKEFWVFIPSVQPHPLSPNAASAAGRAIVDTGEVVHVVPDPLHPAVHSDVETSFQTFSQWGGEDFWDGFESPDGTSYLMLLSECNSILIPFIPNEHDDDLAARACEQLDIHPPFAAVVRPEQPFFQPTHLCFPLAGVIYLLTSPLATWEIVIFLDKRPICQSFAAVRLPCAIIPVQDAVDILHLHVEMVQSHKLWVKGGQKVLGDLVAHHCCTLSVCLEHEDCEYFPSEDESLSSPPLGGDDIERPSGHDRHLGPGPPIADGSGSRPEPDASRHGPTRGGLWGRLLMLSQCFGSGQSLQVVSSFSGSAVSPQHHGERAWFHAADQWREKMLKPSSVSIHGKGLGADTPRFFSLIGDAASIMMLSRRTSEIRLCGFMVMSLSKMPMASEAVVLPLQEEADEMCNAAVNFSDRHSAHERCYKELPPFVDAAHQVEAPHEVVCLVHSDLRTLLDENKGDSLWRLCGALADLLHGIQYPRRHQDESNSTVRTSQPSDIAARQILRLQDLVRDEKDGVEYEMLETLFDGHDIRHLDRSVVHSEGLHEHTRMALNLIPVWDTTTPISRVVLYTDGSFKPGIAAVGYAVVALVEVDASWHFAGHYAGAVSATQLGDAVSISAHTAELCGMIHARLINACAGQVSCQIRYDCQSAAQIMRFASSTWAPLDRVSSWLDAICIKLGIVADWEYVAGHHGDPWNEFADHLAKRQLQQWASESHPKHDIIAGMLHEGWAPWLWISIASRHNPSSWPTPCADGSFINTVRSTSASAAPLLQHPQTPQAKANFRFRVVTYNTLSLKVPGQTECLDEHFGRTCSILGLQETRLEHAGVEHGNHFIRFSSAACQGQGGCHIWLSKSRPPGADAHQQAIRWRADTFVVHHSDPRCLAISGKADGTHFGIVSAHARVSNTDDECLRSFWRQLTSILGQLPERSIKIVMVDANATFDAGRWMSTYYQPLEGNAQALLSMALQTQMVLSDLWDVNGQEVKTWCSPTGVPEGS